MPKTTEEAIKDMNTNILKLSRLLRRESHQRRKLECQLKTLVFSHCFLVGVFIYTLVH